MKRWLLNLAMGVSLLFALLICVLWIRSYPPGISMSRFDRFTFTRSDPQYWIISQTGTAILCRQVGSNWDNPLKKFEFLGLTFGGGWGKNSILWNLVVPYWMLMGVALVLPALRAGIAWRDRVNSRRRMHGLCPKCGYDLRATPDRCPECGTIPEATKGVAT